MKKFYKINLVLASAGLLTVGVAGSALAFHSGGVANCAGCHSMHSPAELGTYLLIGSDTSSTCLGCHENAGDTVPDSYHISTADADMVVGQGPLQRSPGGDFGWLKKDYSWEVDGVAYTEDGDRHGHNIVAIDLGYTEDATNATSPGGSFLAGDLQCNSCHDAHGKYRRLADGTVATSGAPIIGSGSYADSAVPAVGQAVGVYRLLAGNDYTTDSFATAGAFYTGVPAAVAPATYNQSEATNQVRVAYGAQTAGGVNRWGTWCASCHADMHSSYSYTHPVDWPLAEIADLYNAYVSSGIMTGIVDTAFLSLVPFAQNSGAFATLAANASNTDSALTGPGTGDEVMCLSCHRAHASGFSNMLRWNNDSEFMVENGFYTGVDGALAMGRTEAEFQAAYYDRPATDFAAFQRDLCNKCHAQD